MRRLLKSSAIFLSLSLIVCLVVELTSKLLPISSLNIIQVAIIAVAEIAALIYTAIKRPTYLEAAENADYDGLNEIVQTTYEFVFLNTDRNHDEEIVKKMLSESVKAMESTGKKHNTGILPDKKYGIALLILCIMFTGSKFIKTDLSRAVIEEDREIKEIEKLVNEAKKEIADLDNQEILEEFKTLQKALKDVHNQEEIKKELFKNREKLTEDIKKDIEKALSENTLSMLSESEKTKLLESTNPINTIKDLKKSAKENNNNTLSKELSDLEDKLSEGGSDEVSEAMEKLDEIEKKVSEHNQTSSNRGGTWGGSNSSVGATSNLNKAMNNSNGKKSMNSNGNGNSGAGGSKSSSGSKGNKSSSQGGSGSSGNGATIADNGDKDFEKMMESQFIDSEGDSENLKSAYDNFNEYKKLETLGLGDTEEGKKFKEEAIKSYTNYQIDKSSDENIPEAFKEMIKDYYKSIGE